MAAPPARARADYDYLIKLLLIGDRAVSERVAVYLPDDVSALIHRCCFFVVVCVGLLVACERKSARKWLLTKC